MYHLISRSALVCHSPNYKNKGLCSVPSFPDTMSFQGQRQHFLDFGFLGKRWPVVFPNIAIITFSHLGKLTTSHTLVWQNISNRLIVCSHQDFSFTQFVAYSQRHHKDLKKNPILPYIDSFIFISFLLIYD